MTASDSIIYICTRVLHSFLSHCCAASTIIPLLPKATYTPSIKPNLGLHRISHPLTSTIKTLLAIQYSSILRMCSNHLNTLWSTQLAKSLSIPAILRTSSFLTLSIRDSQPNFSKHFISRTLTFLLSALLTPHAPRPVLPLILHFIATVVQVDNVRTGGVMLDSWVRVVDPSLKVWRVERQLLNVIHTPVVCGVVAWTRRQRKDN